MEFNRKYVVIGTRENGLGAGNNPVIAAEGAIAAIQHAQQHNGLQLRTGPPLCVRVCATDEVLCFEVRLGEGGAPLLKWLD